MDFPDEHAAATPDRAAYIIGDVTVTYRELVDASIRIANVLHGHKISRGGVVAILLPNMAGMLEVAWACQRSGLRYTAISDRLTASEIAYILGDSGAQALFTCQRYADTAIQALSLMSAPPITFSVDGPAPGMVDLPPQLEQQASTPLAEECEGTDLLYSSGTTGRPKGVAAHTDFAPLGTAPGTAPFLQKTWGFGADTIYLSPAPLYHAAPMRTCMTVQRFGGTVVIMEKFDAAEALRLIQHHRVTHAQMVPTMFVRMLQLDPQVKNAADTSSLRALIHAAAPCPPAVKKAMIDWVGPIVDEYYSSTEGILLTVITAPEALKRPGSVGRAILGTPHICDSEGNELPPGSPGIIWSENGLDFEYLNDPEKTEGSRNERGWRTVGDIGYLDEEGYLYLSDRRDDLILVGGVNVYPQEAENLLIDHPAVLDAAVFGINHSEFGQEVKAVVQLTPGNQPSEELAAELMQFCTTHLARIKCPRSVEFIDELPRTPTGKLLRRVLRNDYQQLTAE